MPRNHRQHRTPRLPGGRAFCLRDFDSCCSDANEAGNVAVQLDEESRSALRGDDYLLDHGAEDLERLWANRLVLQGRFERFDLLPVESGTCRWEWCDSRLGWQGAHF